MKATGTSRTQSCGLFRSSLKPVATPQTRRTSIERSSYFKMSVMKCLLLKCVLHVQKNFSLEATRRHWVAVSTGKTFPSRFFHPSTLSTAIGTTTVFCHKCGCCIHATAQVEIGLSGSPQQRSKLLQPDKARQHSWTTSGSSLQDTQGEPGLIETSAAQSTAIALNGSYICIHRAGSEEFRTPALMT